MATSLRFVRPLSGEVADDDATDMRRSTIHVTSGSLVWDGLIAEAGSTPHWDPGDIALAGHFIGMNADDKPLCIERRTQSGFETVMMPPGALWIQPALAPVGHRTRGPSRWMAVELSREKVRSILGHDIEPRVSYTVIDEPISNAMRSLIQEVRENGVSGPLYADGLAIAIAARLALLSDVPEEELAPSKKIGRHRLKRVIDAVEARLAHRITVDELAEIAGLSPAHFARMFKRETMETPHAFVLRRRVERARELLLSGVPMADVASECGFSDQAHLCRRFKHRFKMTPGELVRSKREVDSAVSG